MEKLKELKTALIDFNNNHAHELDLIFEEDKEVKEKIEKIQMLIIELLPLIK